MERLGKREWLGLGALFLLFAALFSFLPIRGESRYLSPDETAVAVSAKLWAKQGSAAIAEPLSWKFPGLHPRSYVSHYDTIVPVGFLGWPFIGSILIRIVGQNLLPLAMMLVILSGIYPLYRLLRPLGQNAALLGTLVAYSSPAIILYANRSLFPNAGLIALALWTCFMLRDVIPSPDASVGVNSVEGSSKVSRLRFASLEMTTLLTGALACLTLSIRPIEAVWILPWFVYFAFHPSPSQGEGKRVRWFENRKNLILFGLGALIAFIPIAWQANVLYGSVFQAGYLVQGNPDPNPSPTPMLQGDGERLAFLPFGLHPLYIGWNAFKFLSGALFPWMVPLVVALVLFVASSRATSRDLRGFLDFARNDVGKTFLVFVWTLAFLILYYGNGRYADNITGGVTIGNSFVRYLMPLGILSGAAFAYLYKTAESKKHGRIIALVMAGVLVAAGIFQAFFADNEGLWAIRNDQARYDMINKAVQEMYPQGAIVISERSDKIFFPEFQAWSPPPDPLLVNRLSQATETPILLFARPMSQVQKDAWSEVGVVPVERYSNAREILYELQYVQ